VTLLAEQRGLVLPQFPGLVISMTRATWLRDFWTSGLACARDAFHWRMTLPRSHSFGRATPI